MKKVIAMMLSAAMLLPFSAYSYATSTGKVTSTHKPAGNPISTVEQFLSMEEGGVYYLTADLDFSGQTYSKNVYTKTFKGALDGNGHALVGITLEAKNSDAGIFANGFSGQLSNLTVGSADNPAKISSTGAGYSVGGIAGTMSDGAKFTNVCLYADIKGDGKTAGITSYMPSGSITVENCEMIGSVTGNPASGFIAMSHDGSQLNVTITDSTNRASITGANLGAGGFYAAHSQVGGTRLCDLTVRGCVNFGSVTASDWRVGGIVGEFHENVNSKLDVSYCYNAGPVTMTGGGGFACGIVGGMAFDAPTGTRVVSYCYNRGLIRNTANGASAYGLAFSNSAGNNVIVENCAYTTGTATRNAVENNITLAETAKEMENVVTKYPAGAGGASFVADQAKINEGYPVLSREVTDHVNVVTYDCGRKVCLDCGAILSNPENERHSNTEKTTAPGSYSDGYITAECRYCHNQTVRVDQKCAAHLDPKDGVYNVTKADHLMWYAASVQVGLLSGGETLSIDADLDFTGIDYTPIAAFNGTILGNGHTIKSLKIAGAPNAGLITVAGMGAKISDLALDGLSVSGSQAAGAFIGTVGVGAIVKLDRVAVTSSTVKSDGAAGGIVGSCESAAELTVENSAVDTLTIEGKTAGGIVGSANHSSVNNCYVHATLTGESAGTIGVHTATFSAKNCYYAIEGKTTQNDGTKISAEAFATGEAAYQLNTFAFGDSASFGVKDGKTTLTDHPMKRVRLGSTNTYTDKVLSAGDSVAAYAVSTQGGMTLILVQKRNGPIRLVDQKITVDGKEIAFSALTLTGNVKIGEGYATADGDAVIYTVTLTGTTSAPEVKIGDKTLGKAGNP